MKLQRYQGINISPCNKCHFFGELVAAGINAISAENVANKAKRSQEEENSSNEAINAATNAANERMTKATNDANERANQLTNDTNRLIAQENLGFQRELQEYNKALQDQIFEREDTSYQRTAHDMINAGLNPLSMQGTNGSGEVVAQSPLHNDYQDQAFTGRVAPHKEPYYIKKYQQNVSDFAHIVSPLQSIAQEINDINAGRLGRDKLALENDRQYLENLKVMNELGIYNNHHFTKGYSTGRYFLTTTPDGVELSQSPEWQKSQNSLFYERADKNREIKHKVKLGRYDSDTQMEKYLTALEDWTTNGRLQNLYDNLKKTAGITLNKLFD